MTRLRLCERCSSVLRLCSAAVLVLAAGPCAVASPIVSQFYELRALLSDGRVVEGYGWGVSWIGGASLQEQEVKRVVLRVENGTVIAIFSLLRDDREMVVEAPAVDPSGQARMLTIGTAYEFFHKGEDFYWLKGVMEYPLDEVAQLDTIRVVGEGFAISDPWRYLDLKEPVLTVEDCGLGCEMKFFSRDPGVTKETLHELWGRYFGCAARSTVDPAVINELRGRYRIELLADPFCVD